MVICKLLTELWSFFDLGLGYCKSYIGFLCNEIHILQNYYISDNFSLLAMTAQCLKISLKVIKIKTHLTPEVGPKVKYLTFAITQSVVNIFTEISLTDRGTINMNISNVIFDRKPVFDPLGGHRGGVKR